MPYRATIGRMPHNWPTAVESELVRAGWRRGRRVDTTGFRRALASESLRLHSPARTFLAEYGGLTLDIRGPGVTCARTPVRFDPGLCDGEGERFLEWSDQVGRAIVPIGDLDLGRWFLGIDDNGVVYLVETRLATFGVTHEAVARLVEGHAPDDVEL